MHKHSFSVDCSVIYEEPKVPEDDGARNRIFAWCECGAFLECQDIVMVLNASYKQRKGRTMNEETLNHLLEGAVIHSINVYTCQGDVTGVHVLMENGAILVVNEGEWGLDVDVLGPSTVGEPR